MSKINFEISDQWTAGFFDGEGSLWVQKNKRGSSLKVSISQADPFILKLIQCKYGGKITTWKSNVNGKDVSKWDLNNGFDCINFLKLIYPYLIVKKIQCEFAFIFMNLPWRQIGRGGKRHKLTNECIEMDEMIAYSIKIAKPRHWENYTDIQSPEELIDYIFLKTCEKFK